MLLDSRTSPKQNDKNETTENHNTGCGRSSGGSRGCRVDGGGGKGHARRGTGVGRSRNRGTRQKASTEYRAVGFKDAGHGRSGRHRADSITQFALQGDGADDLRERAGCASSTEVGGAQLFDQRHTTPTVTGIDPAS